MYNNINKGVDYMFICQLSQENQNKIKEMCIEYYKTHNIPYTNYNLEEVLNDKVENITPILKEYEL